MEELRKNAGTIEHFIHVQLDAFIVMPNHIHGIILITGVEATHA